MNIVYFHDKKDKMWATFGAPPKHITRIQLGIGNNTDIALVRATITEKHVTSLDKENSHCKLYGAGGYDFNECSLQFFSSYLKDKINCTLPGNAFCNSL